MELFIQECKSDGFDTAETMDALLYMLEEFGMLPPLSGPIHHYKVDELVFNKKTYYQWEPEVE